MFIGLNPSTANESDADPTIRSVCRIAKNNGYGGVYMMNCWSYIATDPKLLRIDPLETEWCNKALLTTARKCKDVVFAWGSFSIVSELERDINLIEMFPKAKCLVKNKNGSPRHPLYVSGNVKLVNFILK